MSALSKKLTAVGSSARPDQEAPSVFRCLTSLPHNLLCRNSSMLLFWRFEQGVRLRVQARHHPGQGGGRRRRGGCPDGGHLVFYLTLRLVYVSYLGRFYYSPPPRLFCTTMSAPPPPPNQDYLLQSTHVMVHAEVRFSSREKSGSSLELHVLHREYRFRMALRHPVLPAYNNDVATHSESIDGRQQPLAYTVGSLSSTGTIPDPRHYSENETS